MASSSQYSLDEHGVVGQVPGEEGVVVNEVLGEEGVVVNEVFDAAFVVAELADAVEPVAVVVAVGVTDEVELDGQVLMSITASKRSDWMNFMQYANDPTVSELRHCFFTSFAFLAEFLIFLQSTSIVGDPHSSKLLSFWHSI